MISSKTEKIADIGKIKGPFPVFNARFKFVKKVKQCPVFANFTKNETAQQNMAKKISGQCNFNGNFKKQNRPTSS